jgi:hypothetical protein
MGEGFYRSRIDYALGAAQSVDLSVFGKTLERFFGEGELAVDGDLEHTAGAFDELNLGTILFFQLCLRTEGSRKIVSRNAVFDPDLHCRRPFNIKRPRQSSTSTPIVTIFCERLVPWYIAIA